MRPFQFYPNEFYFILPGDMSPQNFDFYPCIIANNMSDARDLAIIEFGDLIVPCHGSRVSDIRERRSAGDAVSEATEAQLEFSAPIIHKLNAVTPLIAPNLMYGAFVDATERSSRIYAIWVALSGRRVKIEWSREFSDTSINELACQITDVAKAL